MWCVVVFSSACLTPGRKVLEYVSGRIHVTARVYKFHSLNIDHWIFWAVYKYLFPISADYSRRDNTIYGKTDIMVAPRETRTYELTGILCNFRRTKIITNFNINHCNILRRLYYCYIISLLLRLYNYPRGRENTTATYTTRRSVFTMTAVSRHFWIVYAYAAVAPNRTKKKKLSGPTRTFLL